MTAPTLAEVEATGQWEPEYVEHARVSAWLDPITGNTYDAPTQRDVMDVELARWTETTWHGVLYGDYPDFGRVNIQQHMPITTQVTTRPVRSDLITSEVRAGGTL